MAGVMECAVIYRVENTYQSTHGHFSTRENAQAYIDEHVSRKSHPDSAWAEKYWSIEEVHLDIPEWASWRIAHRVACPEYGYPDTEARYLSVEEYERAENDSV